MDRRRFFIALAGAGGICALDAFGVLRSARAAPEALAAQGLQTATRSTWALGASVKITALHADRATAERALDAALAELATVQRVMSIYRPESQLSELNREGRLADAHPLLLDVLGHARAMSERTEGAFDVTVQPLWDAYSRAKAGGTVPGRSEVSAARELVDFRGVQVIDGAVTLRADEGGVTLNGLAQGFAVDRVQGALRAHGVVHALVDTGEIGGLGASREGDPWQVGIQHPRQPDAYISLAHLDGRCLATSGDYATSFSDDFTHHHIFDPATGCSPSQFASVTVAANSGVEADMLSTATFVMGPHAGLDLIGNTPGADALCVLKSGQVTATDGFPLHSPGGDA